MSNIYLFSKNWIMQINIKSLVILPKITTGKNLIFVSPEFYLSIDLSLSLSIFYPSVS